jgi:hypothetical protein
MSTKKEVNYFFTIKGICTEDIDNRYNMNRFKENEEVKNTTSLIELNKDKHVPSTLTFLGESKQFYKCNVSMIDHTTCSNLTSNNYHCFWCRNPFDTLPIGCPIEYIPRKISRKYVSVLNNNVYQIDEDTSLTSFEPTENTYMSSDKDYYQTDGIFCSFNCCVSYIRENKGKHLYYNSYTLLIKMYNDMFKIPVTNIPAAPDWRLLKQYGGNLTISDFRSSFYNSEYKNHGIVRELNMIPIGTLFEKRIKF